jgi:hypothetical protein
MYTYSAELNFPSLQETLQVNGGHSSLGLPQTKRLPLQLRSPEFRRGHAFVGFESAAEGVNIGEAKLFGYIL